MNSIYNNIMDGKRSEVRDNNLVIYKQKEGGGRDLGRKSQSNIE